MKKGFKIIYSIHNEETGLQLGWSECIADKWSYYIDGKAVSESDYETWFDDVHGNLKNSIYRTYKEIGEDE